MCNGKDEKYFKNISQRERAIFEGAITMGALFHQFIGTPVSEESAKVLERAIKESMELQPCIDSVEVKIDFGDSGLENEYAYVFKRRKQRRTRTDHNTDISPAHP